MWQRILAFLSGLALIALSLVPPAWSGPARRSSNWEWVHSSWTGNENLYRKARAEIDRELRNGRGRAVERKYRERARRQVGDGVALYRWAYAAFAVVARLPRNDPQRGRMVQQIDVALQEVKAPPGYEFARVYFLLHAYSPQDGDLVRLGNRLFKHNPQDRVVNRYFACLLLQSSSYQYRQRGLRIAQRVVEARPAEVLDLCLLGHAYQQNWIARHDPKMAREALATYRRYLRQAPRSAKNRVAVKRVIADLERATKSDWRFR